MISFGETTMNQKPRTLIRVTIDDWRVQNAVSLSLWVIRLHHVVSGLKTMLSYLWEENTVF